MKSIRFVPGLSGLAAAIAFVAVSPTFAQDTADEMPTADEGAVHCLPLNRIRSSEVLGASHVLFRMVDKKSYVNVLPRPCPGLGRHKTIMYRTTQNQLCDLDIITVLDQTGVGFMPGASCGLGYFKPIDEEDIEDLRKAVN